MKSEEHQCSREREVERVSYGRGYGFERLGEDAVLIGCGFGGDVQNEIDYVTRYIYNVAPYRFVNIFLVCFST